MLASDEMDSVTAIAGRNVAKLLLLAFCLAGAASDKKNCPAPKPVDDPKYHPGQVWSYRTRAGEEDSRVTILKVEALPTGTIVHVRVDGVRIKNCSGGPEPETIEHMPFSRDAVDRSVVKVAKEDSTVPDFSNGYAEWQRACGGVYTLTIAEAIAADESTFNAGLECKPRARAIP